MRRRTRASEVTAHSLAVLARALGAAMDERGASEVVRRHALENCGAETVTLIACGPERGTAVIRDDADTLTAIAGGGTPATSCLTIRLGRPHARRRSDSPLLGCQLCGSLDAETACAPLTAAGAVIGAVLATGPALLPAAIDKLDEIAAVAGPAIASLRAFDLAAAQAHTDPLTALPNRRAAEDAADRMIALSRRSAQALAVMRIDLDGIAAVNNRLGAGVGDDVIYSLSALLRARLRTSDLVARSGGDEFIVLLPDTGPDVARDLAEGLCRLARELTPPGMTDPVTVSVGIASFPVDAESPGDLFAAAERAVLLAKTEGGNRVNAVEPPDPWSLFSSES